MPIRTMCAPIAAPQPAAGSWWVSAAWARAACVSTAGSPNAKATARPVTRMSAPLAALRPAGGPVGRGGRSSPRLVAQRRAGEVPHVGGRSGPRPEPEPHVVGVEAVARQQRLGQGDGHLGVVGELTRRPIERPATEHLADPTEHRLRELLSVLARSPELEARPEGVAHRRSDERADRPLLGDSVDRRGRRQRDAGR